MSESGIVVAEEIADTLAAGRPVVALESTIISHGMPHPANVETAHAVEAAVREAGAVPATIAVIDGRIRVGLSAGDMERLSGPAVVKASRRDLPSVAAGRLTAGTTVAATMFVAHAAGIRVFATGGIGGVHRGYEQTLDASADLEELARTRVAVVCAGIKSILDLPRTLEYLETRGVPVMGFATNELPAFFARESGLAVDYRYDTAAEIAAVLLAQDRLGLDNGVLITNPVAAGHAIDPLQMERHIRAAIDDMNRQGISGKAATPFLLDAVSRLSGGASLDSNRALIIGNATLAAGIASAYAEARRG